MIKRINIGKNCATSLALSAATIVVGLSLNASVSGQTNDVKAVTDVLIQEAAAIEKGDLAALDQIWANDESVIVIESGHANYGWTDYRNNHLAPELKAFKNTKYSFSDMKVKVDGKTAWATFKYTLGAEMGTRKIDTGGLGTAVLEKRDGRWQIVHWHSSAPRRAPQPAQPAPKN